MLKNIIKIQIEYKEKKSISHEVKSHIMPFV